MASKTVDNHTYAVSGYTLSGVFQAITIGTAGSIGGPGLVGGTHEAYTIVNHGRITGATIAVSLMDGGTIENGVGALIGGYKYGIDLGAGASIGNGGTISATGTTVGAYGVLLSESDVIQNNGTGSLIEGYGGIYGKDVNLTLVNAGTIMATDPTDLKHSIYLAGGTATSDSAVIINGTSGLISGGIFVAGTATIVNEAGGRVEAGPGVGILIFGGDVTNDVGAVIAGKFGVSDYDPGNITNYGTILGPVRQGVLLEQGNIINGAGALISGDTGVYLWGPGTLMNAGTIASTIGSTGTAVQLYDSSDLLIDDAGSTFVGVVSGGGGTLELAGTPGTLAGLGIMFSDFGVVDVLAGARWTVTGTSSVASSVMDSGTLTIADTATLSGTITGTGSLTLIGSESLDSGTVLTVSHLVESAGTVTLATNLTYAGEFLESGGVLDIGTDQLKLDGSASIAGTISSDNGTLTLAGAESFGSGTDLATTYLTQSAGTATFGVGLTYAGHFVESGGMIVLDSKILTLTGPASFTGGTISGTGHLSTEAATALASLSFAGGAGWANYGTVTEKGAVTLGGTGSGGSRLSNESGAVFDITANGGIAIATGGSGNIVNVGLIEKTLGTGTSTIVAPIANNGGTIAVTAGTLDLAGALTYTGKETIGTAGTLKFDGAVGTGQTISFAGTTGGELVLNDPSGSTISFAGTVSGFGGSDKLDLATFAFVTGTKPGWTQNGTSGKLTVTEGSKTAKLTLFGQYAAAGFSAVKDAAGDTLITYTTPTQMAALAPPRH